MHAPTFPPNQPLQPFLPENSSIKLIGLGGVGSIVARYGATFLASLDRSLRLVLIDGDSFEPSNSNRMLFGRYGNKAAVTKEELLPRFAESHLTLVAIEEFISAQNIAKFILPNDILILTVDNHATRKLVNDFCASELEDVCLISGGNDGVEPNHSGHPTRGTYGNVQIFLRHRGQDASPSLSRFHPEVAHPVDHLPSDKSCTELVTSVPQILFANLMTATAILNTLWLYLCNALHYSELAFDIADGLMRPTPIPSPKLPPRETLDLSLELL